MEHKYFYNAGLESFPFAVIQGSQQDIGIAGSEAFTAINNGLFWLDNQGSPRTSAQYAASFLSSTQVNYQMDNLESISDCKMFSYSHEGHTFIVFVFPTEDQTWVYDASTSLWHQRASDGANSRWRGNCHTYFDNKHLIGDYQNGKIYYIDNEKYTDDGTAITRVRACPTISVERRYLSYLRLRLEAEVGVGLATGQGSDPQIMMRYSNDHGQTWSNELWRSLGKIGERNKRVQWNLLGRAIDRQWEFTITDPVKVVLTNGYVDAKISRSSY
jgi:hypothetical protein